MSHEGAGLPCSIGQLSGDARSFWRAAPMAPQHTYFETDLRVLAEGVSFALVAALVPDLANTVLVQFLGDGSSKASFGLYVVYREGSTTFEVTSKVEIAPSTLSVEKILRIFVKGTEFKAAILAPLVLTVREHFSALPGAGTRHKKAPPGAALS